MYVFALIAHVSRLDYSHTETAMQSRSYGGVCLTNFFFLSLAACS